MNRTDNDKDFRETLRRQAWAWLRLLNGGQARDCDADGFKRWLRASPAHQAAFQEARQQWKALGPAAGEWQCLHPGQTPLPMAAGRRPNRRRAFLAAGGAAALAGVAVAYPPAGLWPSPAQWGADLRTRTGEQHRMTVAQGLVTLNTATSIRRHRHGVQAGIDLLDGETAIDLTQGQRFTVVAGVGHAEASRAQFAVRYLDGQACVTCMQGDVQVVHLAGSRLLQAGQQVRYDQRRLGEIAGVRADAVSAWQHGELMFDGTPLEDVIDEINRYRPGRVVLMNSAARHQPVTGSFYLASLDQALSQLQHTFGLQAKSLAAGLFLLT